MGERLRPAWGWLILALGLLALAAWLLLDGVAPPAHEGVRLAAAPPQVQAAPEPDRAARPPTPASAASLTATAALPSPSDDLAAHIPPGEVPSMKQVIEGLHARGIRTGLGAFNPPGTRPPLIGLAVPEDFPLPPGYLRHHQATDDGQRIEAILMFAPGFRLFDAQGREVVLPENRVVPPELAPPGLPLRRITVPAPATEPRP